MKLKGVIIFLLLILMSTAAFTANQDIVIIVDGDELSPPASPKIVNGRTLVPMRAIFESLGAEVQWDESTQTVTGIKGENVIKLKVGITPATLNKENIYLDVPPIIDRGSTLVPVRFIAESLGAEVTWYSGSQRVIIKNTDNSEGLAEGDSYKEEILKSEQKFKSKTIIPTLMYHHFVKAGEKVSGATITIEAFEEQMKYLKSKGYNTVTDQQIVDFYYNGKELPTKPIHITMDDGYKSNYELAYPILKKNNMKATIFMIVSKRGGEYRPPRLTWEQMKEMSDSGLISIQSHSYNLHHKEKLASGEKSAMIAYDNSQYHRKVVDDLMVSKQLIENKIGAEVISLAYPFGHYNQKNLSDVKEAGFKIAYTTKPGLNKSNTNPLELHRINVVAGYTGKTIEKEITKQK